MAMQALWATRNRYDDNLTNLRRWRTAIEHKMKTIKDIMKTCDLDNHATHLLIARDIQALRSLAEYTGVYANVRDAFKDVLVIFEREVNEILTKAVNAKKAKIELTARNRQAIPKPVPVAVPVFVPATKQESEPIQKDVYAIVPAYDFDQPMEAIVFASKNEKKTNDMLHYLNNTLQDQVMIQGLHNMAQDAAQDVEQQYVSNQRFRIMEFNQGKLEEHYRYLRAANIDCKLLYNYVALELMINQTKTTKTAASNENDKHWSQDTLNAIRTAFNDKHIV